MEISKTIEHGTKIRDTVNPYMRHVNPVGHGKIRGHSHEGAEKEIANHAKANLARVGRKGTGPKLTRQGEGARNQTSCNAKIAEKHV